MVKEDNNEIKKAQKRLLPDLNQPIRYFVWSYLAFTTCCFVLLILPFFHEQDIPLIDHLFMAISVVSTTGLVTDSFADTYNFGGELIALFFIQVGGVGFMTLGSFIILRSSKLFEDLSWKLVKTEFGIPKRYPIFKFIYSVFIFTITIETLGAITLYYGFQQAGVEDPLWYAIFHSISAFCTAGIGLRNDSFQSFVDYPLITNTIMVLSILGSIGFIVFLDFCRRLTNDCHSLTLTSKIILVGTLILGVAGTASVYLSDLDLLKKPILEGISISYFQTLSALTTVGFNTYDYNLLPDASLLIIILIMFIGASPSGTGGGIKTTTISALYATIKSVLYRKEKIMFFSRSIPSERIYMAIAIFFSYIIILFIGLWGLLIIDGSRFSFQEIFFEASSALSTVGISMGITENLSIGSKLIISLLMFIGRVGTLTFGLSFIHTYETKHQNFIPEEDIAL